MRRNLLIGALIALFGIITGWAVRGRSAPAVPPDLFGEVGVIPSPNAAEAGTYTPYRVRVDGQTRDLGPVPDGDDRVRVELAGGRVVLFCGVTR